MPRSAPKTIAISEFKPTCLAVLERVRRTREGVIITRRGLPVAQVLPPPPPNVPEGSSFGCLASQTTIAGDLVEPASAPEDWDALR